MFNHLINNHEEMTVKKREFYYLIKKMLETIIPDLIK